jgi:hypothetical protein
MMKKLTRYLKKGLQKLSLIIHHSSFIISELPIRIFLVFYLILKSIMAVPPAARGLFLKKLPPGPPQKLFIALRAGC